MSERESHPHGISRRTTEIWTAAAITTFVEGAVLWAPAYSRGSGLLLPVGEARLLECCGVHRPSKSRSPWIDKRQLRMYRDHFPRPLLGRLAYVLPHPRLGQVLDESIEWPELEPWLVEVSKGLYAVRFADAERHIACCGRGTVKEEELEALLATPSAEDSTRQAAEPLLSYFRDWAPPGGGELRQAYLRPELETDGFMWFGSRPTPLVVKSTG